MGGEASGDDAAGGVVVDATGGRGRRRGRVVEADREGAGGEVRGGVRAAVLAGVGGDADEGGWRRR